MKHNDKIIEAYKELGGDPELMSEENLKHVDQHIEEDQHVDSEIIISIFKNMMNQHSVLEDDVVKGMETVFSILESAEDDFSNFLPSEKTLKVMDVRVLEAMDNTILLADEDILGIANNI